jgi:hypothetical protein
VGLQDKYISIANEYQQEVIVPPLSILNGLNGSSLLTGEVQLNLLGLFAIEGIPEDYAVVNGRSGHMVGVRDVDASHIPSVAAVHLHVP